MKQKKYWLAGIAVLAIGIIAKNAPAALVITEAMSSSGTGGTGDWFELTNNGAAAVNITGYKVDDNSFLLANALALTGVTSIGPGQSAVFIETTDTDPTNQAAAITAFRTFWGTAKLASVQVGAYSGSGVGLSSTADGVEVFDSAGNAVNQVSFGVATTGVSFGYNPATGTFGGLSVAGQFVLSYRPIPWLTWVLRARFQNRLRWYWRVSDSAGWRYYLPDDGQKPSMSPRRNSTESLQSQISNGGEHHLISVMPVGGCRLLSVLHFANSQNRAFAANFRRFFRPQIGLAAV